MAALEGGGIGRHFTTFLKRLGWVSGRVSGRYEPISVEEKNLFMRVIPSKL